MTTKFLPALLVGLLCACSAQLPDDGSNSTEQAARNRGGGSRGGGSTGSSGSSGSTSDSCSNGDGVNSALAALAVATARELGRWQPLQDFVWTGNGLALTSTGRAQCADGVCWNTQALLDLQHAPNGTVTFNGVAFVADNFRSTLSAKYQAQAVCESRPDNHTADNCPAEQHKLTQASVSRGQCDTVFTFNATNLSGGPLNQPAQLKNKLIWVGYPTNSYLSFQSNGSTVSIDPTLGLNEGSVTESGACTALCAKVSFSNVSGQCCSCLGVSGTFQRSVFSPYFFLCAR